MEVEEVLTNIDPDSFSPETVIWRYINIEKLLSLLTSRSLFLNRIDGFKDKWEGHWPKNVLKEFANENASLGFEEAGFLDLTNDLKNRSFICCWHENNHESAALWDLYSGRSGVAIRSTIGSLKNSMKFLQEIEIGRAIYVDFDDQNLRLPLNMLVVPFLKRKSFEHEKEVRVLFWDVSNSQPDGCKSILVPVDLNVMINEIRISPDSDPWIRDTVEKICAQFGVNVPVVQSSLYSPLVY